MPRPDGRQSNELRPVRFTPGWAKNAEGSCLAEFGDTKVLCTVTVENTVPPWLRNSDAGWLTAEYGMLPRSTTSRHARDGGRGRPDGRAIEIQRLIGRSLRCVVDLRALGQRTLTVDCDVLQADGGTRVAAISGAWIALHAALRGQGSDSHLREGLKQPGKVLKSGLAAISVGLVDGEALLDLNYREDARAAVDMNVVMNDAGHLIEVQAGGEGQSFTRAELDRLIDLAQAGLAQVIALQQQTIGSL